MKTYGQWANGDCQAMKTHLATLDYDSNGRVPLDLFYMEASSGAFHFGESVTYLEEIGALDNSEKGEPKVIIPNYVTGPSNCIAKFRHFSVCCINECLDHMRVIEAEIKAPNPRVPQLLPVLQELWTSLKAPGRQFPKT